MTSRRYCTNSTLATLGPVLPTASPIASDAAQVSGKRVAYSAAPGIVTVGVFAPIGNENTAKTRDPIRLLCLYRDRITLQIVCGVILRGFRCPPSGKIKKYVLRQMVARQPADTADAQ